jgi:hypothetical protein
VNKINTFLSAHICLLLNHSSLLIWRNNFSSVWRFKSSWHVFHLPQHPSHHPW